MSRVLAVRAGRAFDGERAAGPVMLLTRDGKISGADLGGGPVPEGVQVADFGPDACMLPGLIDAHVHLAFDASGDLAGSLAACDDDALLARMQAAAARALAAGVTTVRDLGDQGYLTLALRDRAPATQVPQILASGPPVTTPGGHCDFLGGVAAGGAAGLRAAVRERAERGCDVVKVMVSGGAMTPGSRPHQSQYDLAALRVIADEARRAGLPTAAHAHGAQAISDALDAGFSTLEHVTFYTAAGVHADQALIDRIAASGVTVSLTVGIVPGGPAPPPAIAQRIAAIAGVYSRLARAVVIPGTDAGVAPGKPHDVLPHAVQEVVGLVGMTPRQALRSATSVAAAALGLAGSKGRIAPGYDADLLVIDGDPLTDITAVARPLAVYRAGTRVR